MKTLQPDKIWQLIDEHVRRCSKYRTKNRKLEKKKNKIATKRKKLTFFDEITLTERIER
jgi:hypothetical protein